MAGYGAEPTPERPPDDACERRFVAVLRQCHLRSARRKPVIEIERTLPWMSELDGDLDRPLVAGGRNAVRCWTDNVARRSRPSRFGRCGPSWVIDNFAPDVRLHADTGHPDVICGIGDES